MSLIGDALKKARADGDLNLPPNVFAAPMPRRSNLPWIIAAASMSLAIGILVGAAVFYRSAETPSVGPAELSTEEAQATGGGHDSDRSLEMSTHEMSSKGAEEPIPEVLERGASDENVESASSLDSLQESSSPEGGGTEGASSGTIDPTVSQVFESSEEEPGDTALESPRADGSATEEPREQEKAMPLPGSSYLRQATLADGTVLNLNGIVWSDTSPAALINNEVFGVGEGWTSWKVVAVHRGSVELESQQIRFTLRLK